MCVWRGRNARRGPAWRPTGREGGGQRAGSCGRLRGPPNPPPPPTHQYHYRPGTISSFISRALDRHARRRRAGAPIRVYMDGCFDVMHYGHANALRQAKALGDELVVGLIPDSEIRRYKVS